MSQKRFFSFFPEKLNIDFVGMGPKAFKITFALAVSMIVAAFVVGLNWGIDFAGGTEIQLKFNQVVSASQITDLLKEQGFHKHQVQQYGAVTDNEWLIRVEKMSSLSEETVQLLQQKLTSSLSAALPKVEYHASEGDRVRISLKQPEGDTTNGIEYGKSLETQQMTLKSAIESIGDFTLRRSQSMTNAGEVTTDGSITREEPYQGIVNYTVQFQGVSDKMKSLFSQKFGQVEVRRVDFVDARVAQEMRTQGVLALVLCLALILIYIAIRFDMYFAPGAVVALAHDPAIALGLFVIGRIEFDLPSVAALLTVIGYSVNGTIIIFDRIRETMPDGDVSFEKVKEITNRAINDTFGRSINTVLTLLITTVAVAVFTEGSVQNFALCLTVGVIVGTVSDLLIAPTVYLFFRKRFYNPKAHKTLSLSREDTERGVV